MYRMRHPVLPVINNNSNTFATNTKDNKSTNSNSTNSNLQYYNHVYDDFLLLEEHKQQLQVNPGFNLTPVPSITGIAFIACAAALPLVLTRNVLISTTVLGLLEVALPFLVEFSGDNVHVLDSAISNGSAGATRVVNGVDIERFQHLLNRLEQVSSQYCR